MNKSRLLTAGLFSLVCLQNIATAASTDGNNTGVQTMNPGPVVPNNNATSPAPQSANQTGNAPMTNPPASTPATTLPATAAPSTTLNCNYHIPAETAKLDTALVMQWAQKAAQQTFDFNPDNIDAQMISLKSCYTDQGWQSYHDALVKSGNLDAIKQQKLNVSSTLDGQSTISQIKDNQWKIVSPIQVVYQNDKEKIIQSLTINLIVSRKVSGDLGIIQIVAIPRQAASAAAPVAATNPSTSSATKPVPAAGITSPETTVPASH